MGQFKSNQGKRMAKFNLSIDFEYNRRNVVNNTFVTLNSKFPNNDIVTKQLSVQVLVQWCCVKKMMKLKVLLVL